MPPSSSATRTALFYLQDVFRQNVSTYSSFIVIGTCEFCEVPSMVCAQDFDKLLLCGVTMRNVCIVFPSLQTESTINGVAQFELIVTKEAIGAPLCGSTPFSFFVRDLGNVFGTPPSVLTGSISLCPIGTGYVDQIGCQACPVGTYNLGGLSQQCLLCVDNVQCLGGSNVFLDDFYWTFPLNALGGSNSSSPLKAYRCPFDYCDRGYEEVVSASSSYCHPGSHRNTSSVLCGTCVVCIHCLFVSTD